MRRTLSLGRPLVAAAWLLAVGGCASGVVQLGGPSEAFRARAGTRLVYDVTTRVTATMRGQYPQPREQRHQKFIEVLAADADGYELRVTEHGSAARLRFTSDGTPTSIEPEGLEITEEQRAAMSKAAIEAIRGLTAGSSAPDLRPWTLGETRPLSVQLSAPTLPAPFVATGTPRFTAYAGFHGRRTAHIETRLSGDFAYQGQTGRMEVTERLLLDTVTGVRLRSETSGRVSLRPSGLQLTYSTLEEIDTTSVRGL